MRRSASDLCRAVVPTVAALLVAASPAAAMPTAKARTSLAPYHGFGLASASAAAPAAATAKRAKVYAGSTSPAAAPMMMELGRSRVSRIAVQHATSCFVYASVLGSSALRRFTVDRKGRLNASVVTSLVDSPRIWWTGERYPDRIVEKFKGKVAGGTARGTVRATVTFLDGSTCTTGDQRWLVTHKPGRVYGGVTSQSMPVSVELSSSGQRINHLHVGWVAPCTDGGDWVVPDFLTNFDLTGGAVDETFRQDYPSDDGWVTSYDYRFAARTTKTTSTGTLGVTVTVTDAAGAVQGTCTSPSVRWTARS